MTFYFYDLETSGLSPAFDQVMQFAGQRTDENFNPIGEPDVCYVAMRDDVLPSPDAIMVTGITPQKTREEGMTEWEFGRFLMKQAFTPGTVAMGYNTIRFDDEFIRHTLYRSFFDPYVREWADSRGRWDLLDLVRMTRALRPEGIEWPVDKEGRATNRLELLTKANGIDHFDAHDAVSDVHATIAIARLLREKQPRIFEHLLSLRDKKAVSRLMNVNDPQPLVYSSGSFPGEHEKTTVVFPVAPHPTQSNCVLVYDLRHDPREFAELSSDQIAERLFMNGREREAKGLSRFPAKGVQINRAPALAPLGVLDEASQERIHLTLDQVAAHLNALKKLQGFGQRIAAAWEKNGFPEKPGMPAEGKLYAGFTDNADRAALDKVQSMNEQQLATYQPHFNDERLEQMFPRFKARNCPGLLSADEQAQWDQYRQTRLSEGPGMTLKQYGKRLAELAEQHAGDDKKRFLLEELQLYGQSIVPYGTMELF